VPAAAVYGDELVQRKIYVAMHNEANYMQWEGAPEGMSPMESQDEYQEIES
jgi:hypothetical protein